jgi:hypothetical protein
MELDRLFQIDGRTLHGLTDYSEGYISKILNEKVDVEKKCWLFLEAVYELECLKKAFYEESEKELYLKLAEQFKSDPLATTTETLASYKADDVKRRRKKRPPNDESGQP